MKQLLLAIAALCVIAGCGDDDKGTTPTPDGGESQTFTFSLSNMPYPCTPEGLEQACVERGYHKATDWLCANSSAGMRVHIVTCWRP